MTVIVSRAFLDATAKTVAGRILLAMHDLAVAGLVSTRTRHRRRDDEGHPTAIAIYPTLKNASEMLASRLIQPQGNFIAGLPPGSYNRRAFAGRRQIDLN